MPVVMSKLKQHLLDFVAHNHFVPCSWERLSCQATLWVDTSMKILYILTKNTSLTLNLFPSVDFQKLTLLLQYIYVAISLSVFQMSNVNNMLLPLSLYLSIILQLSPSLSGIYRPTINNILRMQSFCLIRHFLLMSSLIVCIRDSGKA